MYRAYYKRCRQAPQNSEFKADIALYIKGHIRIIPPFIVEKPFKHKACYKFQRGGKQCGAQKQQQRSVPKIPKTKHHYKHAHAVNGADRSV